MLGDRELHYGCKAFARAVLTRYQLSREEREQELESLTQALVQVLTDCLETIEHRRIGGDGHA